MQLEAVFGLFIFIQFCFRLAGGPGAILGRLMERIEKLSAVAEQCPTDGFLSPMQAVGFFFCCRTNLSMSSFPLPLHVV